MKPAIRHDYGTMFGTSPLALLWRYNLSAGSRFVDRVTPDYELRFYGFFLWSLAIGFFFRVSKPCDCGGAK